MSSHTAGPWTQLPEECDRDYIRVRGTRLGNRYKIANVLTPIYKGVDGREADETRANARLIAAAPDLLEALKELASIVSIHQIATENRFAWAEMQMAREAIAKATGEPA